MSTLTASIAKVTRPSDAEIFREEERAENNAQRTLLRQNGPTRSNMMLDEQNRIEKAAQLFDALLNEAGKEILRRLVCAEIARLQAEEPESDHDDLDRRAGNFMVAAVMRADEMRREREAKKFRN